MSRNDRYFINGIVRALKPRKILEAGVAHGGGSAIILNAIQDIDGAKLYSVDYSEKSFAFPDKLTGFVVEEYFPDFMDKWQIFRGGDVSRFIEKIGGDIDLFMLDTVHTHPWETLNFLCVLPFMKNDSWVVLHDITTFISPHFRHSLACGYLFAAAVSDAKVVPAADKGSILPNIGAFKVSEITSQYIDGLFRMLLLPWNMRVPEKDLADITRIIDEKYPASCSKTFHDALTVQEYMFSHPRDRHSVMKGWLQQKAGASLYQFLQKIARGLRRIWPSFLRTL